MDQAEKLSTNSEFGESASNSTRNASFRAKAPDYPLIVGDKQLIAGNRRTRQERATNLVTPLFVLSVSERESNQPAIGRGDPHILARNHR